MESGLDCNYNAILNRLTSAVKDSNKQTEARKRLRVERWLRVNIQLIENFSGVELEFFSDIFSDDSCWEETGLKNKAVGERITEEKNKNEKENPLDLSDRYYLACKYCLEDRVPELFKQVFKRFKESALKRSRSDDELKKKLLDHIEETSPIEAFWSSLIDKQTGRLNEYGAVDGLKKAIQVNSRKNWEEGIEFFYNKIHNDKSIYNKGDLLINAALSAARGYKDADILEFCLLHMSDNQKKELLKRDFKENTYYAVLSELIDEYCFDSFKNLFDLLESNDLSFKQYGVILSSLSRKMLLNSDLAEKTRETIMYAWKHKNFEECRKSVFKDYSIKYAIADLIADSRKEGGKKSKAEKILEILKYTEVTQRQELKDSLIRTMSALHGVGEEQFAKDEELIEQLFSELDKFSGYEKEHSAIQSSRSDVGAGEPASSPQSSFSLTDAPYHVKSSSHSK
ncbi:MAG: hypothetical protein AB3P11_07155 [Wolbachia pipientis]